MRIGRSRLVATIATVLVSLISASPAQAGPTEDWYKNGTQTTSREWIPAGDGGSCDYSRSQGGTLHVLCNEARSYLVYKMRFSSDKRIIDWWVNKHRGDYGCRTSVDVDIRAGRHSITFFVNTNASTGWAECYIEDVNVTVRVVN